ncbi:MAG: hypothetical protein EXR24_00435 [Ignavibacteria bacterium]|nr:hypothetical protein [Ignavibacteria bacterium]
MSLKSLHVLFISVSTVLSIGLAYWGITTYLANNLISNLLIAIVGLLMMPALVMYAIYFLRKSKNISIWS